MGIFSFGSGKQDEAPTRRGSGRNTRNPRVERRSRRTTQAGDAEAMLLDPTLPEKQRARRRLVGAIALVVAAIVILPMLLDSHPKPVTDDISIDIPNRPVAKATTPPQDTQAGVAPDSPSADAGMAASSLAAGNGTGNAAQKQAAANAGNGAGAQAANTQAQSSSKPAGKSAAATQQPSQSMAMSAAPTATAPSKPAKPAATPAQSTESTARSNSAASANADSGTPAAPSGARFALQLGVFQDDASAKTWAAKLKAAGVPAYTERRKQADSSTQTLLRAGPFPDRASASAAIAKVRAAGLVPGASSGAAQ